MEKSNHYQPAVDYHSMNGWLECTSKGSGKFDIVWLFSLDSQTQIDLFIWASVKAYYNQKSKGTVYIAFASYL